MLAQLAARLRQRQAGVTAQDDGDGEGEGEGGEGGGAIVVDDNCAVRQANPTSPDSP